MKGSYVLLIKITRDQKIQIGKLGNLFFKKGFYVYTGSALNNIEKRIQRHLKKDKKFHWHVDYLLDKSEIVNAYYKQSNTSEECKIAKIFSEKMKWMPDFGCSDCNCKSHLFYGPLNDIKNVLKIVNMKKYLA